MSPRQRPTGWRRLGLALASVAAGVLAGLATGVVGLSLGSSPYGALALGLMLGLAGFLVVMPVLAILLRLGPVFAAAATLLVPIGFVGYVGDEVWTLSLGLVSTVLLVAAAWLTDPARGRSDRPSLRRLSGARVGVLLAALVVLGAAVPPVAADLKGWRETTVLLEELVDPPLLPAEPGLEVHRLRRVVHGVEYLVTDPEGLDFVAVTMYPVDSRPVGSGDCFTLPRRMPRQGCAKVAPGVYRAEHPDEPRSVSYYLPREHSVTVVGAHVTGLNEAKYGLYGRDDVLRRIATSLRPVPVQSLAQQDCRLCRLMLG